MKVDDSDQRPKYYLPVSAGYARLHALLPFKASEVGGEDKLPDPNKTVKQLMDEARAKFDANPGDYV
jgi:hypothetical protein